ncbi:hypothetical protein M9Y10_003294 [Tritrichomonas musculus]|uniref:Uncharacterized protein n=1 Tax=Tritrichomonas musculus TaxID=1915356 RepID=A0ABR2JP26_9EUKA
MGIIRKVILSKLQFYHNLPVQKDRSNLPFVIHIGLDGVRSKLIEIETTASNQVILSSDGRGEPVSNDKTLEHQFNNPIDVEALLYLLSWTRKYWYKNSKMHISPHSTFFNIEFRETG